MKPAYYMLVCVLLLIVGAAALLIQLATGPSGSDRPGSQVVYVNLDRLVRSHPAHAALAKIASSDTMSGRPRPEGARALPPVSGLPLDQTSARWARQHLEFRTAQSALSAFGRLEELRNQRLDLRLKAMRETAYERSAAEIEAETRRLTEQRDQRLREVALGAAAGRINASLRLSALRAALMVQTTDRSLVERRIASEESELRAAEEAIAAENSRIESEWRQQTESLSQSVSKSVDASLSVRSAEMRDRIRRELSEARTAFLSQMGGPETASAESASKSPRARAQVRSRAVVQVDAVHRSHDIRAASGDIVAGIREIAARQAAALAEEKGWHARFAPARGVPDKTDAILRLLDERAWGSAGSGAS